MKSARRDRYARPRTAPDMHHDASYEVASSAEVDPGPYGPIATISDPGPFPGKGKGLIFKEIPVYFVLLISNESPF